MAAEFDDATALARTSDHTYTAELGEGWVVEGGVNGGDLLAVVGRAIRESLPRSPDPLTVSAYYLSASVPGAADVAVTVKREGGSTWTVAADLSQDGVARLTALATYGDLSRLPDDVRTTATEPELPPREDCWARSDAPRGTEMPPLLSRFDLLLDPATGGWAIGKRSGRGLIQGWFRLADDREPDALSLLFAVDAMPPVTFELRQLGWAPTLELTAHVRADPAPGWLKLRHETRNVAGGMFEEDCEVWDSAGRLVAQSRQLARQPRSTT